MSIFITKEYVMKKIVRLNESMIQKLVRKVLQEQKNERYMFFSNLEQMKRQCEMLLDMDEEEIVECQCGEELFFDEVPDFSK